MTGDEIGMKRDEGKRGLTIDNILIRHDNT